MAQVKRLAYVQIEAKDLDAWKVFGRDVLACELVCDGADELRFRVDDRPWRIQVTRGDLDDIAVAGLEVDSQEDLETIHQRLRQAGVPVRAGSAEECGARGVRALLHLHDPAGLPIELSYGSLLRPQQPFNSPLAHGGFVTGDQGLGHLMMVVDNVAESHRFYCDMLGFITSDFVSTTNYGGQRGDFVFMRCNKRHHTMAMGKLPIPRRLGHLMLQVRNFDDVGRGLDRVLASSFRQTRALGRHINDHMFSFYVESPSGLQFEYGWGGLEVEDGDFDVKTYDVTSAWGHQHLLKK